MRISVRRDVFKSLNSKAKFGFLLVKDADNKFSLEETKYLLLETQKLRSLTFNKNLIKNHHMITPWDLAKEHLGKDAHHHHTSVEKLLHQVISKNSVVTNNVVSNIARYLSLKYIVPINCLDIEKVVGDIVFSIGTGHERMSSIKRSKKGMIIYSDNAEKNRVLGTQLGTSKNPRIRVSPKSNTILMQIVTMPPVTDNEFKKIMLEAEDLLRTFTKGSVKKLVIDTKSLSGKF